MSWRQMFGDFPFFSQQQLIDYGFSGVDVDSVTKVAVVKLRQFMCSERSVYGPPSMETSLTLDDRASKIHGVRAEKKEKSSFSGASSCQRLRAYHSNRFVSEPALHDRGNVLQKAVASVASVSRNTS